MSGRGWKGRGAPGVGKRKPGFVAQQANAVRVRLDWQDLADRARAAASLSDALTDADTFLHLSHLVARTGHGEPPFESASDRLAAQGYRLMVKAWTERAPELRAVMADAIAAGARLIDQQIHDERMRAAAGWQGRYGGD